MGLLDDAGVSYLKSKGEIFDLQSSNSKHVKYSLGLCANCNNSRTQPHDRAYDKFIEYVEKNSSTVLARRQINFEHVFGNTWRDDQANLFLYFAKAFGCRIADAGMKIPQDISELFDKIYPKKPFAFCFSVDEDERNKPSAQQTRLGITALIHNGEDATNVRFSTAARYRWLIISYWYNWGPFGPMGEPWIRNQQFICLGSYRSGEDRVTEVLEDGSLFYWPGIDHLAIQ